MFGVKPLSSIASKNEQASCSFFATESIHQKAISIFIKLWSLNLHFSEHLHSQIQLTRVAKVVYQNIVPKTVQLASFLYQLLIHKLCSLKLFVVDKNVYQLGLGEGMNCRSASKRLYLIEKFKCITGFIATA